MVLLSLLLPAAASPADPLVFPTAPSCRARTVEIAMVGDVMQHGMQLRASLQDDGSTSWRGVFDPVEPLLARADLAIANLETPIDASRAFGGFPRFNAPESLLVALSAAGVDLVQTANNHCLDQGRSGLLATLDAVERHGFGWAGTWRTAADHDTPWVVRELPGPVRVAFLGYTYGTNGLPMPEGEPWMVNWLDRGQMQHDIARAREHADLVIAGVHWGAEYQHQPQRWQRELARSLADAGADVVMGSHPHVLQPAEVLQIDRPEGRRDALVLYSLGNFVSNQRTPYRDGGVVTRVSVSRCVDTGEIHVSDVRFTPVWVDDRAADGALAYRVLPVPPPDAACPGLDLSDADCVRMARFRDHTATLLPADRFSWDAGPTERSAARPLREPLLPGPFLEPPVYDPPPGDAHPVWPPPALQRTQHDPPGP